MFYKNDAVNVSVTTPMCRMYLFWLYSFGSMLHLAVSGAHQFKSCPPPSLTWQPQCPFVCPDIHARAPAYTTNLHVTILSVWFTLINTAYFNVLNHGLLFV